MAEEQGNTRKYWDTLEYEGPAFPPPYEPNPEELKLSYDGEEIELSADAEEVAGFYAKMLHSQHTKDETFNKNFFEDWHKVMTEEEREKIKDFKKCNFKNMQAYFVQRKKNCTKEEKDAIKQEEKKQRKKFGFCTINGKKIEIDNFKIRPPGLFIGRGKHPKNGKLKKRIMPEDVQINCSEDSRLQGLPAGVRKVHKPNVMWLSSWKENIGDRARYIVPGSRSKPRSDNDKKKYDIANKLLECIDDIRSKYQADWTSKDNRIYQCAIAIYFIDMFLFRVGNEKDTKQEADTVGCCSLRKTHITLPEPQVVKFNFLGKASVCYRKKQRVEKIVFEKLQRMLDSRESRNNLLFDSVKPEDLNKYLNELMEGLTTKVFRTYHASVMMRKKLNECTSDHIPLECPEITEAAEAKRVNDLIESYKRANGDVQKLLNHTTSVTSKQNYIDPRITVAWCRKNRVPIGKIFNIEQLKKFNWAIILNDADYIF